MSTPVSYLTAGGASVDLTIPPAPPDCDNVHVDAECSGCGGYQLACVPLAGRERVEVTAQTEAEICGWAQGHAEKCRRLPRPLP